MPGEKNTWAMGHGLTPTLGEYSSRDRGVIEEHIRWATQYGINLLEVSWAGPGRRDPSLDNDDINIALQEGLLSSPSIKDIKFLLVYETEKALNQEAREIGYDMSRAFVEDILYANEKYLHHPSYFQWGDRPVIMVWKAKDSLSVLLKECGREVEDVFAEIENTTGRHLFWVSLGEDVYAPRGPDPAEPMLNVLDGVAPLLGDSFPPERVKSWREYLDNVSEGYTLWGAAAKRLGFAFIPSALPGFDDRAFEKGQNRLLKMDRKGFKESLRLARERAREGSRWVSIYGFNEWFESGAVEPTKEYGLSFLEVLREVRDEH